MKSDSLCKKVSVSLPSNVHIWLKQESEKESKNRGSRVTVSSLIQEILKEWKDEKSEGKGVGVVIQPVSEISASGPSIATKKNTRRAG
jgi:hypothetical protein